MPFSGQRTHVGVIVGKEVADHDGHAVGVRNAGLAVGANYRDIFPSNERIPAAI